MNMSCCHKHIELKWVRGNDVLLLLTVYEPVYDGQGMPVLDEHGNQTWQIADLDAYDEWAVKVYRESIVDTEPCNVTVTQGEEKGTVLLEVPCTLPDGNYSIEMTARMNGGAERSFERMVFSIVESNGESHVTFDVIEGESSIDLDLKIQLVTQAVVRGENAYQMWKKLPGNEDKTLQDYIEEVLDMYSITANAIEATDAANTAAGAANDAADAASNVDAEVDGYILTVTNRYNQSKSVDTKGVSIVSFTRTGATFTDTIYTITYSDGTTQEVAIPKGEKGDPGQIQSDWTQTDIYALDYIKNKPDNFAFIGDAEGSATTADFDTQADTVWHIPQILSFAAKAQARANIGAQGMLTAGSGIDITNDVISTEYSIMPISQSYYDNLQTKDSHTLYIITS